MEKMRKTFDLSRIDCICFHYDESNPVKSKKQEAKADDNSRFDVYTPEGIIHLRSEKTDSEKWVAVLQKAAAFYNPQYRRDLLPVAEVKIVVLGDTGVGKSGLINALHHPDKK